jgi:hypothetical protein
MSNIGTAIARVAAFIRSCRVSGWSRDGRVAYAGHIESAACQAGMSLEERGAFVRQWALDLGGTGPVMRCVIALGDYYLVEGSKSRGSVGGIGRTVSEDKSYALVFESPDAAHVALAAQMFHQYDRARVVPA